MKKIKILLPVLLFSFLFFHFASADGYPNLLGCDSARECIMGWIKQIQYLVAGIAMVVIIIAGIFYLFSGGNLDLAEKAKKTLIGAVLGFGIVIGAAILINEVGRALGWKGATDQTGGGAKGIITRAILFIFSLVGLIGMGGMITGAIFYLTAAGDESRVSAGKRLILYSIIGVVVAISAAIIVSQIERIVT